MSEAPYRRLASVPLPWRVAAFLAACVLVWIVSTTSVGGPEAASKTWSLLLNLGHVPLFGLLAFTFLTCLGPRAPQLGTAWLATLSLVLVAGVLDEWHQGSTAGRSSDVRDVVTDLMGGVLALLAALWASRLPLRFARAMRWLALYAGTLILWGWYLVSAPAAPLPFASP